MESFIHVEFNHSIAFIIIIITQNSVIQKKKAFIIGVCFIVMGTTFFEKNASLLSRNFFPSQCTLTLSHSISFMFSIYGYILHNIIYV